MRLHLQRATPHAVPMKGSVSRIVCAKNVWICAFLTEIFPHRRLLAVYEEACVAVQASSQALGLLPRLGPGADDKNSHRLEKADGFPGLLPSGLEILAPHSL